MLGLISPSNSAWITAANSDIPLLLADHAHCEKKAAAMALSLLNRYCETPKLVGAMLALAAEELEHCARIHAILLQRGIPFTHDRGDDYAKRLQEHVRKQEPGRMIDSLLVAALIEARSCERFTILSKECCDLALRDVYRNLLASEAGHYSIFTELAREASSDEEVRQRYGELVSIEADIVRSLTNRPTMHG